MDPDGENTCGEDLEFCKWSASNLESYWGKYEDNDPVQLLGFLRTFAGLSKKVGGGFVTLDFIHLNPNKISPKDDLVLPGDQYPAHIYNEIQRAVPEGSYYKLTDGKPPFEIQKRVSSNLSFKIDTILLANLNGRISQRGLLDVDTDGDGLFDYEETATSPTNPRSNGVCLDVITKTSGCIMPSTGCNAQFDLDSDGLNDCEERTVNTKPDSKDTDSDGIIDSLEVILATHPLQADQNLDFNSDGIKNFAQILAGVHPQAAFKRVKDDKKIGFQLVDVDHAGTYNFSLNNLPLVSAGQSVSTSRLFLSDDLVPASEIKPELIVGPTSHPAGTNQIVVVIKARAVQNPEVRFWLFLKMDTPANQSKIELDLNKAQDLNWMGN